MRTLAALAVMLATPPASGADAWRPVRSGVSHQVLAGGRGHAFRVDLSRARLEIAEAPRGTLARVDALVRDRAAVLAVNGGFFAPDRAPLGLLVSRGRELNPLRRADWGVLSITRSGQARLVHTRQWRRGNDVEFAVQAGPRLVVEGRPLHFKAQVDVRTAIGILPGGRSLVIVVTTAALPTADLATLMAETFGCTYALNLDGGSSTQLHADGVAAVAGAPVANAVLVVPIRKR